MLSLISNGIASLLSYFKKFQLQHLVAGILVVFIFLSTSSSYSAKEPPVGERIGEQLHQSSKKTERPKTTGEFLKEAEENDSFNDVASDVARDSAEAFGQFGKGITTSIKETAREIGGNAAKAVR